MLNILATEEKKKILTEYRLRLAVVSVFAVAALVFSSLILLSTSYLLAVSKYNDAKTGLVALQEKDNRESQEKDVTARILAVNKNIDLFLKSDTTSTLMPSSVITKILDIKGSAVKIIGFTYDANAGQERIVVIGTALNRDSLARFVEALKKDPMFTSVDVPISSYVKSSNIDFSVVIVRKTKK
ncbi:MAG: hypothetical protein HZB11_02505 [Candidatus Yonathbacteria bacterium]|nr:hypothetical protein [Candidatus Yonathbacteria bacterium]